MLDIFELSPLNSKNVKEIRIGIRLELSRMYYAIYRAKKQWEEMMIEAEDI